MRTRNRRYGWGLAVIAFCAGAFPGAPVRAADPVCHLVALNPRPGQIFAMIWSFDGRELAMTDVTSHQLLRYRPDGSRLGIVGAPSTYTKEFKPTQLHATPEGFLVRSSAYDWIWFDRDFKATRSSTQGFPPRFSLINEASMGQDLAGFGSFPKKDGNWTWAFVQVGLKPAPKITKVVKEISYQSKGGDLALVLNTVSATAGETPYAPGND
jgi:hypothetical protein